MPSVAQETRDNKPYELLPELHAVMEYSGLSLQDVLNLPCDMYQCIIRRIVIDKMMSTKEGREQLEEIERLNTTDVNTDKLSDFRSLLGV